MAAAQLAWVYTGLRVRDLARSIRFYRRIGFEVTARGRMQHGGRFVDLKLPGSPHALELNFYPTSNRFFEPFVAGSAFDHFGFEVGDVEEWARRFRRGHIPLVADFTEGVQRLIYVSDPDGNWLEFYGPVGGPPARRKRRR